MSSHKIGFQCQAAMEKQHPCAQASSFNIGSVAWKAWDSQDPRSHLSNFMSSRLLAQNNTSLEQGYLREAKNLSLLEPCFPHEYHGNKITPHW